jgi:hypothetical protein
MLEYPILVFATSLGLMWLSAYVGTYLAKKIKHLAEGDRADFVVIITASLTLLGLIIGFTYSMAITRYDLRKDLEAAEANAIGTEMARAGLLPSDAAAKVRELLRCYLRQRVLFYTTGNAWQIQQINGSTAQVQAQLWSAVQEIGLRQPTPVIALVIAGMNDVLNSQAYTQAAWRNRVPFPAWILMLAVGICCNGLLGYAGHRPKSKPRRLSVFPLIVSISFFLIADIDSPRGGIIRVKPLNLETVTWSSAP